MTLFLLPPLPEPGSYDQKLTIWRSEMLAKGIHPVTGQPLLTTGESCKTCVSAFKKSDKYWKCERNCTNGPKTDLRVSWPACKQYEQEFEG